MQFYNSISLLHGGRKGKGHEVARIRSWIFLLVGVEEQGWKEGESIGDRSLILGSFHKIESQILHKRIGILLGQFLKLSSWCVKDWCAYMLVHVISKLVFFYGIGVPMRLVYE